MFYTIRKAISCYKHKQVMQMFEVDKCTCTPHTYKTRTLTQMSCIYKNSNTHTHTPIEKHIHTCLHVVHEQHKQQEQHQKRYSNLTYFSSGTCKCIRVPHIHAYTHALIEANTCLNVHKNAYLNGRTHSAQQSMSHILNRN